MNSNIDLQTASVIYDSIDTAQKVSVATKDGAIMRGKIIKIIDDSFLIVESRSLIFIRKHHLVNVVDIKEIKVTK